MLDSVSAGVGRPPFRLSWQVVAPAAITLAILAALGFLAPSFFRLNNITNILLQASTLGVLAIGMTCVMIGGGIDLSMPANVALSAVLGALVMQVGGGPWLGALVMLVAAVAIGAVNGVAVAYLGMIPFVVTLASMTVALGACVWLTSSVGIAVPDAFADVLTARPLGIPVPVLALAAVVTAATVVLSSTVPGRWVYAVGINARAARVARVPVARVLAGTYVASGLTVGLTAILLTARLGSASANMGSDGVVLDIVSSCVVGGVSIYGGAGKAIGAVLGAIFITVLSNSMNLIGVSFYFNLMIKGLVIIAFIAMETASGRSR
jgi:ribose transport system permease protein